MTSTPYLLAADYGVKADGWTDDRAALQRLADAALARGADAVLGRGNHLVSGAVSLRGGRRLLGAGRTETSLTLKAKANGPALVIAAEKSGARVEGWKLEGLRLDGNAGQQTAGSLIELRYACRGEAVDLEVTNYFHAGLVMVPGTDSNGDPAWPFENEVHGCLFSLGRNSPAATTEGFALDLVDAEENSIHSNAFEFNGAAHVRENVVGNNAITSNAFVEGSVGIWSNGSRGRWAHNVFDRTGTCFRVVGNNNVVTSNAAFEIGQTSKPGEASFLQLDWGATGNLVTANQVISHSEKGRTRAFVWEKDGNNSNNLVTGNVFTTRGALAGAPIQARGVLLSNNVGV